MMPICEQSTSSCEIKLRELEIDSYSKILSVFRARGNLSNERRKLLKQIGSFLNISRERHRAEIRRVTNDELLSTIATRLTGQDWTVDWNEEGKRLVPTGTPCSNFTVNTPFADYIASVASLGKKYVELYNQRVCNSVPNVNKSIENVKSTSEVSTENWTEDVSKLFSSVQKDKYKDVSIQTTKIKVVPRKCTYCERRKKKRLESKKATAAQEQTKSSKKPGNSNGDESSEIELENSILLPSGKRIIVENAFDNSEDLSVSVIAQEIVVETEPIVGSSQSIESSEMASSAMPMSVNLTTPDFSGLTVDPINLMPRDYMDPNFQHLFPKMWENVEQQPDPPRIPRILNSAVRKKSRKQSLPPVNYSTPERGCKKKEDIEYYRECYTSRDNSAASSFGSVRFNRPPNPPLPPRYKHDLTKNPSKPASRISENVLRYQHEPDVLVPHPSNKSYENLAKRQVGVLRHESLKTPKQREPIKKYYDVQKHRDSISQPSEVIYKSNEISKYQDVVARRMDNSVKPMGGIYKHYVRVRHTPKSKGYSEIPYHQTQYLSSSSQQVSETIEIPIEYIDSEPSSNNSSLEVVEVNDLRMATAGLSLAHGDSVRAEDEVSVGLPADHYLAPVPVTIVSPDFPDPAEIPVSTSHSSNNNYEGMGLTDRNDPTQKKVIKIFNGEKKTHKSLHFQPDNVKEEMGSKLTPTEISGVKNGCQPEDTSVVQTHTIWDGASLSEGEFIMEDVSIVESSYPVVNGHEEIVVEEVMPDGEIIEGIVNKSGVCVIPQTDMKFSVMDISDYADSIETIHSVSSQSRDDSRDSDIIMN